MVEFNHDAHLTQSLTQYTQFVSSVNSASFQGSLGNSILRGLTECYQDMRDKSVDKNRVIVLLTGGPDVDPATNIVSRIKSDKIGIMTVGIGNSVNEEYLKEVATTPKHYFPTTFDDIDAISQKAVARICNLVNSGVIGQIAKKAQNNTNLGNSIFV